MAVAQNHIEISIVDSSASSSTDFSEASRFIHEHLRAEVELEVGPAGRLEFLAIGKDRDGHIKSGIRGFSHWSWLYISHLWTSKSERSKGMGSRLLQTAEAEAKRRGLLGLYVDTFNVRARAFYLMNGFEEFGRIDDFPPGNSRFFLKKRLQVGS